MPAKLDPKVAEAMMLKVGLKPLEPYIDSRASWKCKCLKCGEVVSPRLSTVKTQKSGCRKCGVEKRSLGRTFSQETAIQIMIEAKLQPLEPYRNSQLNWKCKCLTCGAIVKPQLTKIRAGEGGCRTCKNAKLSIIHRMPEDKAINFMLENDLQPLETYKNARTPWKCKCLKCGSIIKPTFGSIRNGRGCLKCGRKSMIEKTRMTNEKATSLMMQSNLKPLGIYKGSQAAWKSECLICGKIVSPSLATVSGGGGCKYCAGIVVDAIDAIAVMKSKGYEPQVPYKNSHANWKSIHKPCGNLVSPPYAQIQQGRGGCKHCAEWGFQYDRQSYLYLITHQDLNAHKVGIANVAKEIKSDRLRRMKNDGWEIFKVWHFEEGKTPEKIEKLVFKRLRIDRNLSSFLTIGQMKHGGETETVNADEISLLEIEKIINKVIKGLKK